MEYLIVFERLTRALDGTTYSDILVNLNILGFADDKGGEDQNKRTGY
jgi:hypothetical protein